WSGRVAVSPAAGLTLGLSGQRGQWLERSVLALVPVDVRNRSVQSIAGTDGEFGRGRLLVRGEWLRSAFQIPLNSSATTLGASAGFLEARYRWHPHWQVAGRADRLSFSPLQGTIPGSAPLPWDAPVRRVELSLGFRPV